MQKMKQKYIFLINTVINNAVEQGSKLNYP